MFSILKGFAASNPWLTVLLLAALIGVGFSGGVWLESLIKNAEISKLVLEAEKVRTGLAEGKAAAEADRRDRERALVGAMAKLELDHQNELAQKEKDHEAHINAVRKFERDHAADNFVIPDSAMLVWMPSSEHPSAVPSSVPEPAGAPSVGNGPAPECRLSDLLADRTNYKDALDRCGSQVRECQGTLLRWREIINGH